MPSMPIPFLYARVRFRSTGVIFELHQPYDPDKSRDFYAEHCVIEPHPTTPGRARFGEKSHVYRCDTVFEWARVLANQVGPDAAHASNTNDIAPTTFVRKVFNDYHETGSHWRALDRPSYFLEACGLLNPRKRVKGQAMPITQYVDQLRAEHVAAFIQESNLSVSQLRKAFNREFGGLDLLQSDGSYRTYAVGVWTFAMAACHALNLELVFEPESSPTKSKLEPIETTP